MRARAVENPYVLDFQTTRKIVEKFPAKAILNILITAVCARQNQLESQLAWRNGTHAFAHSINTLRVASHEADCSVIHRFEPRTEQLNHARTGSSRRDEIESDA